MSVTNLQEAQAQREKAKEARIAKKIAEDFEQVLNVLDLSIRGLAVFKKYTPVMEVMASIQTNKSLIEIKLAKYRKEMREHEKN